MAGGYGVSLMGYWRGSKSLAVSNPIQRDPTKYLHQTFEEAMRGEVPQNKSFTLYLSIASQ